MPCRVEIGGIGKQEAKRIADAPVALDHALEYFVGDEQLARVVGAADPQPEDLRAQRVGHFLRRHHIALRLRHLAALAVDDEAVGQQALVGRLAVGHAGHQQRGMEPAAMLVRALQVEVGGERGIVAVRAAQHRVVRRAGVEPDIQRVAALLIGGTFLTEKLLRRNRLPRLDTALLHTLGYLLEQLRRARVQCARLAVQEERHRHAPLALARQRPVRPVADHAVQPRLPPRGEELGVFDAPQGCLPKRFPPVHAPVHRGEPLRGRPQDHRRLVPPAVHVAVNMAFL